MCGIAGILNLGGDPVAAESIEHLTHLLAHRGPDGGGTWFSRDRSTAFGHRRLAIIDPEDRANQPMVSADGRYVIVYNGEVYNFLELRVELMREGAQFRTESDTEVILQAWRHWGEAMLHRFNGMWAFAIHDTQTKETFLARDRFGVKPLLYALTSNRFMFASEMHAIVASRQLDVNLDQDVARRIVLDPFSVEGGSRTLFKEVQRLQAGHCLWLQSGRTTVKRWWSTVEHLPVIPVTEAEQAAQFGELFRDAVALRMRSDVPIGTGLSGGFDSSAVLCTMAEIEKSGMGPRGAKAWRHAFVASFPGMDNDERPQAQAAAAWARVSPTIVEIDSDSALEDIDSVLAGLDDIYIGLPTAVWQLYREMRRHRVLVSLDGHGADELMGAYSQDVRAWSFRLRNYIARLTAFVPGLARGVDVGRAVRLRQLGQCFLRGGICNLPPTFPLVGDADRLPDSWGGLNRRLYRMLHGSVLPTILRNFDRLSMAHGIEVRMPFLDWRLVTYTMSLPDAAKTGQGLSKMVARRAMDGRMPESIRMERRKVGFNSPMPNWLNGPLVAWVDALLAPSVPAFDELIDGRALAGAVARLRDNRSWDWYSAGRIWPYLHLKWMLARLPGA